MEKRCCEGVVEQFERMQASSHQISLCRLLWKNSHVIVQPHGATRITYKDSLDLILTHVISLHCMSCGFGKQ